jgi:hypothetical protein
VRSVNVHDKAKERQDRYNSQSGGGVVRHIHDSPHLGHLKQGFKKPSFELLHVAPSNEP